MTLSATKIFMNWTGVTVTPAGGSAIPLVNVTDVQVGKQGNMKEFFGDAAVFAKAIVSKEKKRTVTIKGADIATLATIPEDTACTVVAILNDLKNGVSVGGGGVTVTVTGAILASNPFQGQVNNFGTGDVMFHCQAADGTTDPLTIVAL